VAFVVLKSGYQGGNETAEQLIKYVRETYGAIATPSSILFVSRLPKTRSGKIMRRVLRAVATGGSLGDLTTLEDEAAVDEVKESYEQLLKEVRRGR
ncbi:MAG: hypothetical protein QW318_09025, partial [Candidatus Caldarchaeum sp.]